jgi:hypothetical protein
MLCSRLWVGHAIEKGEPTGLRSVRFRGLARADGADYILLPFKMSFIILTGCYRRTIWMSINILNGAINFPDCFD